MNGDPPIRRNSPASVMDIAEVLLTGTKPDFDNVQGLMAEVIQGAPHGFKDMKREDALAIADYLRSILAIKNKTK